MISRASFLVVLSLELLRVLSIRFGQVWPFPRRLFHQVGAGPDIFFPPPWFIENPVQRELFELIRLVAAAQSCLIDWDLTDAGSCSGKKLLCVLPLSREARIVTQPSSRAVSKASFDSICSNRRFLLLPRAPIGRANRRRSFSLRLFAIILRSSKVGHRSLINVVSSCTRMADSFPTRYLTLSIVIQITKTAAARMNNL